LATPRTPGGSSSGSGVSVAAGFTPWAIGTDTGGSVRLPASWCGLSGLKTTIGRVTTYGILPLAPSLDTPGPMARNVLDAALLYGVMQGADPLDHRTLSVPAPTDVMTGLRRGVRGMRFGRMPASERQGCAPEVLAAYDAALKTLEGLGAEIVDVELCCGFADTTIMAGKIIGSEGYQLVGDLVDNPNLPIDDAVRPRIQIGRGVSARDYIAAQVEQATLKAQFLPVFDKVDAILTPTTQTAAVRLEAVDQTSTPAHFTRLVNLLELCALAVPDGFTNTGLPLGLQIICRPYDEATALRIGYAYQQATDWHERHPAGLD
jgi:aspartyl-tRNA(Asn)/glutamyl-tRNA(Gln) amidotransferase subunit A